MPPNAPPAGARATRPERLRVILDRARSGAWNMAIDEALLEEATPARGWSLRFYRWSRPTISLGYAQRWTGAPPAAGAATASTPVVRRPTGGRAVLHADELTYALVGPVTGFPATSIGASYRSIAKGLLRGISYLGADVDLQRARVDGGIRPPRPSAACFLARSRYEVVAHDRKLIGSAQCRRRGFVLQHGSILLGAPDARLWRAMGPGGGEASAASIGLAEIIGALPADRSIVACLARGLAEELELVARIGSLSRCERRRAAAFARRYRDPVWTRRL